MLSGIAFFSGWDHIYWWTSILRETIVHRTLGSLHDVWLFGNRMVSSCNSISNKILPRLEQVIDNLLIDINFYKKL